MTTPLGESHRVTDDIPPYSDNEAPPPDNVRALPNRTPPPHLEAERAVLGALLLEPERFDKLATIITGDDFDEPRHQTIWDALATVHQREGHPPDRVLLLAELQTTGQLGKVAKILYDLPGACPTTAAATTYAQHVHDSADRRRIALRLRQAAAHVDQATPQTWHQAIDNAMAELDQALDFTTTPAGHVTYTAFDGLFSRPRTPIAWVRAPLLAKGRITLMYSPGKAGKSLIAMEAAAAIATGKAAFATDPQPPEHVLYVDQEMTEEDWLDRLTDMGYGRADEQLLSQHLHLAQLQVWPAMDTPAGGAALAAEAARLQATTVIIDTVSKVIAGEENANDTQQAFYRNTLIPLKRAGAAVLVLDHTGKDIERGARGASAKTDNIDLAFELLKRGRDLLTLRCTHARIRDDILEKPTFLRRTEAPLTHVIEAHDVGGDSVRPTHLMERVSTYVLTNEGATRTAIETAVKGKAAYVRLALELLVQEQYIEARPGPNRAVHHHHIKHFRESEETA